MRRDAVGPGTARSGRFAEGFALVEVLVALAVAASSSLAGAVAFTAALRATHAAAAAHRVLDVASDAGERLRAVGRDARPEALVAWTLDARSRLGGLPGTQPAPGRRVAAEPFADGSGTWLHLRWVDRIDAREHDWALLSGVRSP